MQRWCAKLRSLSLASRQRTSISSASQHRLLPSSSAYHTSDFFSSVSSHFTGSKPLTRPLTSATSSISSYGLNHSQVPCALIQLRYFSQKSKDEKWNKYKKKWTMLTPATSKVKKTKMKGYSSYKGRFRLKSDGTIKRWREGKQHNAHSKTILNKNIRIPVVLIQISKKKATKTLNRVLGVC